MKIQFENVDFNSRSGPNGFGLKLARQLARDGHELTNETPDVRLAFIQSDNSFDSTILRLDGIYFNSAQDWERMNEPIKKSYDHARAVIVQSEFDKQLVFRFFGERENVHVIRNGTDVETIERLPPYLDSDVFLREKVWMCASSWRPHKRLAENIRLFQKYAERDSHLVVAGANAQSYAKGLDLTGVHFVGDLTWEIMIAWMKSAAHFVHLAWLDHCPNVVVDAKACGCRLHVSDSGGTPELVGEEDFVYDDEKFDFSVVALYEPPSMTLRRSSPALGTRDFSISTVTKNYIDVMERL